LFLNRINLKLSVKNGPEKNTSYVKFSAVIKIITIKKEVTELYIYEIVVLHVDIYCINIPHQDNAYI